VRYPPPLLEPFAFESVRFVLFQPGYRHPRIDFHRIHSDGEHAEGIRKFEAREMTGELELGVAEASWEVFPYQVSNFKVVTAADKALSPYG